MTPETMDSLSEGKVELQDLADRVRSLHLLPRLLPLHGNS
jgi:hypothetical protein